MTSARLMDRTIRIICSENEIIDTNKLRHLYRAGVKLVSQNQDFPIIIQAGQNVIFCKKVRKIVERLEPKWKNKTIVFIAG